MYHHRAFLQLQGEEFEGVAAALYEGDLDRAGLSPAERELLAFVATITRHAYKVTDEQVEALRQLGWTDAQLAEAVYTTALYNALVRIADAFDIDPHDIDGVLPERLRER